MGVDCMSEVGLRVAPSDAGHAQCGRIAGAVSPSCSCSLPPRSTPRMRALAHPVPHSAWAAADSIADLTQVEPVQGGTPSGRTVVKVLADAGTLVIGIVAYDPEPD